MRKLGSAILTLLALPMCLGGIFEMEGLTGSPNLFHALAFSLGAQGMMLAAGYISSPPKGKIGFFRATAFGFFFLQSVPIPMALFALAYKKFVKVDILDSDQLIWYLVESGSAFMLLLLSTRAWNLSLWRPKKPAEN